MRCGVIRTAKWSKERKFVPKVICPALPEYPEYDIMKNKDVVLAQCRFFIGKLRKCLERQSVLSKYGGMKHEQGKRKRIGANR